MGKSRFFEIVDKLTSLYVTYRGRYIVATNGRIFVPPKKLDNRTVINHVNQRYAIGVFSAEHGSKFICFDVDLADANIVRQVMNALERFGFPRDRIYVSTSGGKGFHVEMFFTDLVYLEDLRKLYLWVIREEGLDPNKVEFRPTFGQSIKLPLSKHHKTGNICWYLNRDTLEPIEDQYYVTEIVQMDRDTVEALIQTQLPHNIEHISHTERKPSNMSENLIKPLGDEHMNMTGPGMCHNLMKKIAAMERYRGASQEEIEAKLKAWAARQNPAFITDSWSYVMRDAESLAAFYWKNEFHIKSSKVFITETDFKTLLALHGMYKKKVLFLIMLFYRRFGTVRMSCERMARYVGASPCGVYKVLHDLEEAKLISVKPGTKYHADSGEVRSTSNEYVYKFDITKPAGEKMYVAWDFKPESFCDLYVGFMNEHVSAEEKQTKFTLKERKELNGSDSY